MVSTLGNWVFHAIFAEDIHEEILHTMYTKIWRKFSWIFIFTYKYFTILYNTIQHSYTYVYYLTSIWHMCMSCSR